ncbi:hypothetical protein M9H77_30795 [Catharanthus roseus]|uniref:Uncharacterized protein n=1 Tax=Catharanthus roseus TaxID=4058 RepID=A0ACB9ZY80_CATRO|nr:hypothetical protein M9H77_30795 [Catharanthus roseus]
MGNKQLIAENLTNKEDDALLYEEFKQYLANKKKQAGETSSSGSYSQDDLIRSYMEELKKELVKNLLTDDKTDISMAGSSNEVCLAGESQDPDMDEFSATDIDQMVQDIKEAARKELKD